MNNTLKVAGLTALAIILVAIGVGAGLVAGGGLSSVQAQRVQSSRIIPAPVVATEADAGSNSGSGGSDYDPNGTPSLFPRGRMMHYHTVDIPEEYAALSNPASDDADSVVRGQEIYETNCASCHGTLGWGDGPAATGLDPAPATLAHTVWMLPDTYLFYRISEGGDFPLFNSAMPAWKAILDDAEIWDVINYLRTLAGHGMPGRPMWDSEAWGDDTWPHGPWHDGLHHSDETGHEGPHGGPHHSE